MKSLKTWDYWMAGGKTPGVAPEILNCWKRSQDAGVPMTSPQPQAKDSLLLLKHRKRRSKLLQTAETYLRHLRKLVKSPRYSISLVDDKGIVLRLISDAKTSKHPLFFEGANWSEGAIGTNGAGTVISSGKSVVIFGPQHYCTDFHDWTCIAAPVKNGKNGHLLGAINLSLLNTMAQPHLVGIVFHVANSVSMAYKNQSLSNLLAATMAHETKNPLTVASGFLQLLTSGEIPDQYQSYVRLAQDSILEANDILSNFTHLLKSRHGLELGSVDLLSSINDVTNTLSQIPLAKNIDIQISPLNPKPQVKADDRLLRCVWINIIKNALEEMDQGKIDISFLEDKDTVTVDITDQGPGIPKDVLTNIFKPFTTAKSTGSGLGLAICKDILTSFGGKIAISCPPKGGTSVKITLRKEKQGGK